MTSCISGRGSRRHPAGIEARACRRAARTRTHRSCSLASTMRRKIGTGPPSLEERAYGSMITGVPAGASLNSRAMSAFSIRTHPCEA